MVVDRSVSKVSASDGSAASQRTPVRFWNSVICQAIAATRPMSSSTSGRSPVEILRTVRIVSSTVRPIASVFSSSVVSTQALGEPDDVHLQPGEHLAELVVDLARDVRALLLAHGDHMVGERTQPLLRLAQLLLGLATLGDLARQLGVLAVQLDEHRNLGQQHLGNQRLDQVVDRADLVAAEHRAHLVGGGGQEDDRRQSRALARVQQARGLEAVDAGHAHVQQDQCEVVLERRAQRFLAGVGEQQPLTEALEQRAQGQQVLRLVVDEKDIRRVHDVHRQPGGR